MKAPNPHNKERQPRDRDAAPELGPGASRVEYTYRKILSFIVGGLLTKGDRLPSESEMAVNFGVSRPVVREALTRLQQSGVIEIRRGAGSFVLDADNRDSINADFGTVESLDDVRASFEIRVAFESRAAALAAMRGTAATIAHIRQAFDKMEDAIETQSLAVDADLAFHMAIAVATQNPFFAKIHQSFLQPVTFSISLARSLSLTHPQERLREVQREHAAILSAIERGEPEQAAAAMTAHLDNACRRLFQGPFQTIKDSKLVS
jgi:GntR family transcriptional regulator, transcriptional repressor for pyruvate dehydrogenase complex